MTSRRGLFRGAAAALGSSFLARGAEHSWNAGSVAHVLPTVSHDRILLKASFDRPLARAPRLRVGGTFHTGQRTDTRGQFWAFDATRLEPARPYELQLVNGAGRHLCDPWTLKTFPAPSEQP